MTALWAITALSTALACVALVCLAKVRDDLTDERDARAADAADAFVKASEHADQRYRDGFAAGVETAGALAEAGIAVLSPRRDGRGQA